MKMMTRQLSVLLVLIITAALLAGCGADSSAKISSPALVSKVTQYGIDYSSDDKPWVEDCSFEYEYKDAYPVSLKMTEPENTRTTDFRYKFKDGVPVSMTCSDPVSDRSYPEPLGAGRP